MRSTRLRVRALERRAAQAGACRHGLRYALTDEDERAALAPCARCGKPAASLVFRIVEVDRDARSAAASEGMP